MLFGGFVGATNAGSFTQTYNHPVPAAVANGDRMLLFVTANAQDSLTNPSGWTLVDHENIGSGTSVWLFTRVADSEPANYSISFGGSHWHWSQLLAFRGFAGIRDWDVNSSSSAQNLDMPSLSAQAGDTLVGFGFNWNPTTNSFPSELTVIHNNTSSGGSTTAYEFRSSTGATPTYTYSTSQSGRMATYAVLLEPLADKGPIYHVGSSSDGAGVSGNSPRSSITLDKPPGTAEGDLLLFWTTLNANSSAITPPSGVELVDNESNTTHSHLWAKFATNSEPSSYTFTDSSTTSFFSGALTVWRNVPGPAPSAQFVDSTSITGNNVELTIDVPDVQNGDLMIATASSNFHFSFFTPSGWTFRYSRTDSGGTGDTRVFVYSRIANNEPANYTFEVDDNGGNQNMQVSIMAFRGLTLDTESFESAHVGADTSIAVPSNTGNEDDWHFVIGHGATEAAKDFDPSLDENVINQARGQRIDYEILDSTGATVSRDFTNATTSALKVISFMLEPMTGSAGLPILHVKSSNTNSQTNQTTPTLNVTSEPARVLFLRQIRRSSSSPGVLSTSAPGVMQHFHRQLGSSTISYTFSVWSENELSSIDASKSGISIAASMSQTHNILRTVAIAGAAIASQSDADLGVELGISATAEKHGASESDLGIELEIEVDNQRSADAALAIAMMVAATGSKHAVASATLPIALSVAGEPRSLVLRGIHINISLLGDFPLVESVGMLVSPETHDLATVPPFTTTLGSAVKNRPAHMGILPRIAGMGV